MPAEVGSRRCGVAGSPIRHSLSPVLHRAAYRSLGLDWTYDGYQVSADGLEDFLAGLGREWRGLSLTMPLKRRVVELADSIEPVARLTRSANTLVIGDDGTRAASNTDVAGFVRAFAEAGVTHLDSVLLAGAGATAASGLVAAAELGARRAVIAARSTDRASGVVEVASELGIDVRVVVLGNRAEGGAAVDAVGRARYRLLTRRWTATSGRARYRLFARLSTAMWARSRDRPPARGWGGDAVGSVEVPPLARW